jgi:hypothetical protein
MSVIDVLDYTETTAAHAAETGRTVMSRDAKARFGDLPGIAVTDCPFR